MGDLACPVPLLQPHYKTFTATTDWSASVPRIGTLPHVALTTQGSPSRRPGCRQHPVKPVVRIEATDSPVPCQGLQRAHATSTPDTARATSRPLPGSGHTPGGAPLSRGWTHAPVSMSSLIFSMRQQWFTHVRLLVAHLTR
jgi:hypothetical protein